MTITIPEFEIPDWLVERALRAEKSIAIVTSFDPRAIDKFVFVGLVDPTVSSKVIADLMSKAEELEL